MKTYIKSIVLFTSLAVVSYKAMAQTTGQKIGANPTIKETSALLELEAADKGLLVPRVALTSITLATPVTAPANALTVFNTATAGMVPNNVTPGYYYWSTPQNKWIRLIDQEVTQDLRLVGTNNHVTQDAGVGHNGTSLGTGRENIAIGNQVMGNIVNGNRNIGIGWSSLFDLSNGEQNIVIGNNSGGYLGNENNNIIIGNSKSALNGVDGGGSYVTLSNSLRISDFIYGYENAGKNRVAVGDYFYNTATDHLFKETFNISSGGLWIKDINTAAYAGNTATDKLVVADANGVLKTVASSALSMEPWQVQGFTTKATANNQAIYQNAKVAIGDFSTGGSPTGETTKQFEVKGDFKAEITAAGGAVGTEVGSPLNPNGAMHYWSNGTDYRTVSANDLSGTLEAKTGTTTNTVSANGTQSAMSSLNGTNSLSTIRTTNAGNFFMETYNVTGNYGSTISLQNDGLRLVHTTTNGSGNPFPNNNRTELLVQKENGIGFDFRDATGTVKGNYWLPTTSGAAGQVMTQTASGKAAWSNPVAMPQFFYAPSLVLPTTNTDLPSYVTYAGGTFTVNLHGVYSNQFGMTGNVAGPTRSAIKSASATTLPVLGAAALEYFVTYFDNTVFDPNSITLSDAGILTYQVLGSATVSEKTYMNIVFKVK